MQPGLRTNAEPVEDATFPLGCYVEVADTFSRYVRFLQSDIAVWAVTLAH